MSDGDASPSTLSDLAALARSLYVGGPTLRRKTQHWRPYICPFDRLLRHVPAGASVLDVGCGRGLFLGLLAATGRPVRGLGFDSDGEAVAAAVAMAARLPDGPSDRPRFERRDVADPWPEGPFDVVSVIDVMHHVLPASQRTFLEEACRATRLGGLLLYKDMARRPAWRAVANRLHDLVMARQWIHYAPIEEVESWAAEAGMTLVHAERIDRLWYGHELRVFRRGPAPQGSVGA